MHESERAALICLKVRSGQWQWDTKNIYHAKPHSYSQLQSKLLFRFHICACLPTINALSDGAFADGSLFIKYSISRVVGAMCTMLKAASPRPFISSDGRDPLLCNIVRTLGTVYTSYKCYDIALNINIYSQHAQQFKTHVGDVILAYPL